MRFSLNGVDQELTADQVRDRLTGVLPGRVRHHGVRVDKRIHPIKQVVTDGLREAGERIGQPSSSEKSPGAVAE